MGTGSFPGVKTAGRDADPSPPSNAVIKKEWSYTSTPPMGRTACTEPQCLYKGALYLFTFSNFRDFVALTGLCKLPLITEDVCAELVGYYSWKMETLKDRRWKGKLKNGVR